MFQLIYHSRYTIGSRPLVMVRDILATSEANNYRNDITGFLIFDKSSFIQVLEGERNLVEDTYIRICDDTRHSQPTLIATRDIEARAFPEWSMGGFVRSPEVQHIYAEYGLGQGMEASELTADAVVALAQALAAFENIRKSQRSLSR